MKRVAITFVAAVVITALTGCAGSRAFQQGERYAQQGKWDEAVKEYRDANKRSPEDIEYRSALLRAEETAANQHYKQARNFLKERKLDQAIVELQQALYLNPTNAAIQSALKSVLNMKQAEEHYRAYLSSLLYLQPDLPAELSGMGHSFMMVLHVFFANLFLMVFPFSQTMHSFLALPINKLRRG